MLIIYTIDNMKKGIFILIGLLMGVVSGFSQITVNTNFKPNIAAPLDLRSKINTLADTATIPFVYDGSIAYVVSEDVLYYKNSVKWVEIGGSMAWANIIGIPSDIVDGDDDTQLSQAEVNAFETDPVYSAWDKDYNDLTNKLSFNNIGSGSDVFKQTTGSNIVQYRSIVGSSGVDVIENASDLTFKVDTTLIATKSDISDFITSANDADFDPTNELQTLTDNGATFTLSNGGGSVTKTVDTDTQLSEAQVDAYADNNGYLLTEVDGSIDNEIQTLTDVGATFTLSDGGGTVTKTVDTNTQLSEAQVDAYADNNGYLETEVDGSITNELQTLTDNGATFTLSNGGGSVTKTVDTNTQLSEAQVDAYADNNGYLLTEVDGSITNEIQDTTNINGLLQFVQNNGGDGIGTDTSGTHHISIDNDLSVTNEIQGFDVHSFGLDNILKLSLTDNTTTHFIDLSSLDDSGTDDQMIDIVSDWLMIENGNSVDLEPYLDNTDTQLSEAQVDAYADNNGYLETEVDGSISNELQTLTDNGATFTLSNGGGSVTKTVDTDTQLTEAQVDAFADNNGYLETEVDGSITNEIQDTTNINGLLQFVQNNGGDGIGTDTSGTYHISIDNDLSATNELQSITKSGQTVTLNGGGGSFTDDVNDADSDRLNELATYTKLNYEPNGAKQGDLWTITDPAWNNELFVYDNNTWIQVAGNDQVLSLIGNNLFLNPGGGSISLNGYVNTDDQTINIVSNTLYIEDGNSADLTPYLDNTDTQLSEAQVDAYADNNGYLETEVDGSVSNELQTLTDNGSTFTLSNGGGSVTKTVDTDTQLSEAQVDAYADNNGYLETEVDGSISNELQTLTDNGSTFTLSNGGGSVTKTVDTNTQLSEAQVDAYADNNGYLETEVDGSITNEIQTISKVGQTVTLSNSGGSFTDDVNDADFDPTNEIQDTTNIVGLLEFVQNNGGSSGGKFVDGTDPLDAVYMDGDVGIGTNTPSAKLEIASTTSNQLLKLSKFNSTENAVIELDYGGSGVAFNQGGTYGQEFNIELDYNGLSSFDQFAIRQNGSNSSLFKIINSGNVGIGTDTPAAKLDVAGDVRISDRIGGAATKSAAFDANGQIVEVDLTTADGKFVDGTDPLDAVYMDGDVGIGNTNPQAKLHIDGQTILTNTNGTDGASLFLGRSGNVEQAAEINFVENSSAAFSYGFRFRLDGIGNKLHLESNNATTGSPSLFDLMAFNRAGGVEVENSLAMNGVFTQEFPKDSGLANTNFGIDNLAAITSGNYNFSAGQGNFKSSTSLNYTFSNGLDNFKNMTTPSVYLFANGLQNFPSATDADYSFINGFRNGYVGTATLTYATISGHSNYYNTNSGIYGSTAFGLNNAYSNTGNSYYEFYNGAYNAQDATSVGYNFMSGYRNAADASSITYSFLAGDRNLSTTTADMTHNFMVGRNNAEKALDSDYSFAVGYFNAANSTTADLDYTFLSGYQNAYVGGNMESAFIHGFRNGYNCTGSLRQSIMIGYENGYGELANLHNSILLGYRQGYTDGTDAAGHYKLAIGMYQDQPLIFGDFVTEEVEITGSLAISDRIVGAATKNAAFDADGHIVETDLIATGYGGAETGLNTISSTAATQVLFNAVFGSDINTNTDITTGEDIEVTNAGIWEVSFSGNIGSYTADEILSVNILINGTLDRSVKIKAADVNSAIAYTYHLNLSANDAISLELDSTTDADYTYNDVRLILNRIN